MAVAKRASRRKAKVALARTLAVVLAAFVAEAAKRDAPAAAA